MVARVRTLSFEGIQTREVEVQVQVANGMPAFSIVGLPDKAVAESRERVRSALHALGLSLPPKRVTVNLAPADLVKEGSHFDLPIALGVMAAMGAIAQDDIMRAVVLGELGLDGSIRAVNGILPAAIHAKADQGQLICPGASRQEALWAGDLDVLAPDDLLQLINHFKRIQILPQPDFNDMEFQPAANDDGAANAANDEGAAHLLRADMANIKGQETAKRALEIAAAGGHNLLMIGPPGAGKSMMAHAFPSILPPLTAQEALDISLIHSLAGTLPEGGLMKMRPFRDPHHSASLPALIGGGNRVRPGEVSLAHGGVLFLDELPEFARSTLEALRQPLETGSTLIARANQHVTYPARFQLIAAMNPCRCGHLGDTDLECNQAPRCGGQYQSKISGPLLDRIDIRIEIPAVSYEDLSSASKGEPSAQIRKRVVAARQLQHDRYARILKNTPPHTWINAHLSGDMVDQILVMDQAGRDLLHQAASNIKLSARGYYRMLKVARTIADLDGHEGELNKSHIAQALSYRR